jgi:hypothetical protein
MATKGSTGKGAILSIGNGGSGETFTPVMQLKQIEISGQTIKFDDQTNLGSPAQGAVTLEEALPTTASPGQVKISGIFLPTDPGQTSLASAYLSAALTDFKLTFPLFPGQTTSGMVFAFSGWVQDMPNAVSIDFSKTILFSTTIKLNTPITVTAGA